MSANAMLIRCLQKRPGGTTLTMADGGLIKFTPDENGDHVAMVSNPAYIQRLLGIPEGFAIHAMPAPVAPQKHDPAKDHVVPASIAEKLGAAATASDPVPAPEKPAAPDDSSDLSALTDDELKAVYRAEWNKEPQAFEQALGIKFSREAMASPKTTYAAPAVEG